MQASAGAGPTDDELLINSVRHYPVIYDKSNAYFHKTNYRESAFRQVSEETGIDGRYAR